MCRCLSLKNKVSPTTTLHTVVGQVKILDVVEDDVINKKSNYRLTETNVGVALWNILPLNLLRGTHLISI